MTKPYISVNEARLKIKNYCAYQERCHQEVIEKLYAMGLSSNTVDELTVELIRDNFLNEERFAKLFCRSKFNQKQWGRVRIEQALRAKDISDINIRTALKEIEEGYRQAFEALFDKLALEIKESDAEKKRQKLINQLLYRGWESHLIYERLSQKKLRGVVD